MSKAVISPPPSKPPGTRPDRPDDLPPRTPAGRLARWVRQRGAWLLPLFALAVLALAGWTLHSVLAELRWDELSGAMAMMGPRAIAAALGLTALSYLTLVGYDLSALRHVAVRLPLGLVATASFCGYAIGNMIGFAVVTGGSIRYRLYSAAGVGAGQIGRIAVFAALAFVVGVTAVSAAALLIRPDLVAAAVDVPALWVRLISIVALALVGGGIWLGFRQPQIALGRLKLRLPSGGLMLFQLAISASDLIFAGAALWVLLPVGSVPFTEFIPIYGIAVAAGLASHVPGGAGVFEAVLLVSLGHAVPVDRLVAALVVYRAVYYLVPLVLATLLLAASEIRRQGQRATAILWRVADLSASGVPALLAALAVLAGGLLLANAAVPAAPELEGVRAAMPDLMTTLSAWAGSLLGVGLIVLAQGLYRRLDAALWLAAGALGVGLLLALLKQAWFETAGLTAILAALLACRRRFDRATSLTEQPLTPGWGLAVAAVLAAFGWLALFTMDHREYANSTWWRLTLDESAPPPIRGALVAVLAAGLLGALHLLRPPRPAPAPGLTDADRIRALDIARRQDRADALLVLLGDKDLLFSDSGRAFVMYARRRGSHVALLDPVGPAYERRGLIRRFMAQCAAATARPAFYLVRPDDAALYTEAGLELLPLGEAARIRLAAFDLAAPAHAALRERARRVAVRGLVLRALEPAAHAGAWNDLATLSTAWLGDRPERGFALGAFSPAYLDQLDLFSLAERGRPVAFAALLGTGQKREVAIDLLRHRPDLPPDALEFFVLELIRWYAARGVEWLDLGLAPLAGFAAGDAPTAWSRLGRGLFAESLPPGGPGAIRAFKQNFAPVWEPRFLAAPRGLGSLTTLRDVAALLRGQH